MTQMALLKNTAGAVVMALAYDAPIWVDAAMTRINLTLYDPNWGALPFTLDPADTGARFDAKAAFAAVLANGGIGAYVAPAPVP